MKLMNDRFVVKKMLDPFLIPEFEIIIDDSLGFTKVFGCFLPEDHALYLEHLRSTRHVTVSELVKKLESYKMCSGVYPGELTSKLFHYVIPFECRPTGSILEFMTVHMDIIMYRRQWSKHD